MIRPIQTSNTTTSNANYCLQALEPAGLTGLTAAQLNAQVIHLRTLDHAEPLPPEVVAMYNRTTVGERSRVSLQDLSVVLKKHSAESPGAAGLTVIWSSTQTGCAMLSSVQCLRVHYFFGDAPNTQASFACASVTWTPI